MFNKCIEVCNDIWKASCAVPIFSNGKKAIFNCSCFNNMEKNLFASMYAQLVN